MLVGDHVKISHSLYYIVCIINAYCPSAVEVKDQIHKSPKDAGASRDTPFGADLLSPVLGTEDQPDLLGIRLGTTH